MGGRNYQGDRVIRPLGYRDRLVIMPLKCWGIWRKSDIRKTAIYCKINFTKFLISVIHFRSYLFFQDNVQEFLDNRDWEERLFFLGEKCFPVGKWVLSVVSVSLLWYAIISLTYFTCFNQLLLEFGALQEVQWRIRDFWWFCCRENLSLDCVKFCS